MLPLDADHPDKVVRGRRDDTPTLTRRSACQGLSGGLLLVVSRGRSPSNLCGVWKRVEKESKGNPRGKGSFGSFCVSGTASLTGEVRASPRWLC